MIKKLIVPILILPALPVTPISIVPPLVSISIPPAAFDAFPSIEGCI